MATTTTTTTAYLEIILGGMFAGKSSRLIYLYEQAVLSGLSVIAINHASDNRYHNTLLCSHDNKTIPCIRTNNLLELVSSDCVNSSQVVFIDESQFFSDLVEFVQHLLQLDKHIYICGLDGDFQCRKIGHLLDLIPWCDKVTKLTSFCKICNDGTTPGIFSKRISKEQEQFVVGHDNYLPVCRKCYRL